MLEKILIFVIIPFTFSTVWGIQNDAFASTDPMATEVAKQTWNTIPKAKRMHYCDTQNENAIVKRYNKNATRKGKQELRKAYRYILSNC